MKSVAGLFLFLFSVGLYADEVRVVDVSPSIGQTTPGSTVVIFGGGFSPDAKVFFSGLQSRETTFIDTAHLEVVTPYLRPGNHSIQVQSGGIRLKSGLTFTSIPSEVDSQIDLANSLAQTGQAPKALRLLQEIADTAKDYQVRSFAYYQKALLDYATGDWPNWPADSAGIYLNADQPGMVSIQTYWPYGLAYSVSHYLLARQDLDGELLLLNGTVEKDVTDNPAVRFYRALFAARTGNPQQAKDDIAFCSKQDPQNSLYTALAAYTSAVLGQKSKALELCDRVRSQITEGQALCLIGEAEYTLGREERAKKDWAKAGDIYPLGAGIALLAGKKHLWRGEEKIASMLLTETIAMAPSTSESNQARELLSGLLR